MALASPNFAKGSFGRAFITPAAGSAATISELEVTGYEINIDSDLKTYDNNAIGRYKGEGNLDATGTLKMHWDNANQPSATNTTGTLPGVRDGAIFAVQLQVDGTTAVTNSFRLTIIADQLKTSSEFTGTLDFECTWHLQSGSVKYPGDT